MLIFTFDQAGDPILFTIHCGCPGHIFFIRKLQPKSLPSAQATLPLLFPYMVEITEVLLGKLWVAICKLEKIWALPPR